MVDGQRLLRRFAIFEVIHRLILVGPSLFYICQRDWHLRVFRLFAEIYVFLFFFLEIHFIVITQVHCGVFLRRFVHHALVSLIKIQLAEALPELGLGLLDLSDGFIQLIDFRHALLL